MDDPRKAGDILVSLKMLDPGFKAATVMSMTVTGAEHATSTTTTAAAAAATTAHPSTTTTTMAAHHIDTTASAAVAAVVQGCSNKCQFSHDGSCDDGGANSVQVRDVFRRSLVVIGCAGCGSY